MPQNFNDNLIGYNLHVLNVAASNLSTGVIFDQTIEGATFWQRVIKRFDDLGRGRYNTFILEPITAVSRPEHLHTALHNADYLRLCINNLRNNNIPWDLTAEGSEFWQYVIDSLQSILNLGEQAQAPSLSSLSWSGSNILYHYDTPSVTLRASRQQNPPVDNKTKNLGKKPDWYGRSRYGT